MAFLNKSLLCFVVYMIPVASALAVTTTPVSTLDTFTEDFGKEYFILQKTSFSPTCPSGWTAFGKRCFMYVSQTMAWVNAELHCIKLGANLVSFHEEKEYQAIKDLIRARDPEQNPTWIGLSACQERYKWIWSDGTSLNYTKWNSGEPNHTLDECCVHMNWDAQKDWNDMPCSEKYPFICVKRIG